MKIEIDIIDYLENDEYATATEVVKLINSLTDFLEENYDSDWLAKLNTNKQED